MGSLVRSLRGAKVESCLSLRLRDRRSERDSRDSMVTCRCRMFISNFMVQETNLKSCETVG